MANRALNAKVERARRQARELAVVEYSKPAWSRHETIGAANAKRAELATLCNDYVSRGGVVTRCEPQACRPDIRKRAGCDPRTRGHYRPGNAVRAASMVQRGF